MGLFSRWSSGCISYDNGGVGTYPTGQSVFHYLRSVANPVGTPCDSILPDSILNTLFSTTFLSHELFRTNVVGLPCTPFQIERYLFEVMKGQTSTGTLTQGEDGCNPAAPPAQFAFDGNPADTSSWSMVSANLPWEQYRIIPSIFIGTLTPGQSVLITTSTTVHRQADQGFAENVQIMYEEIDSVRSFYQSGIAPACFRDDCQADCVWPGDINGDFIVNHCDLLPLGVHLNQSGPERNERPFWHASEATPWPGIQANGKNLKHADSDGDGTIEIEDFHISENNYLYAVPGHTSPAVVYQEGPELYITLIPTGQPIDPNHLKAGQNFAIRIWLDGPDNLYGLAYQLEYDTAFIKEPNLLGPGLEYYNETARWTSNFRIEGDRFVFDQSWVRTHPDSTLHNGKLFTFLSGTHEAYPEPFPSANSLIRLRNIKGILNDGTEISLGSTDLEIHVDDIMTGATEDAIARNLKVYPNPAADYFNGSFANQSSHNAEMRLVDILGRTSFKTILLPGENNLQIAAVDLPEGIYFLCIENQAVEKVCVVR